MKLSTIGGLALIGVGGWQAYKGNYKWGAALAAGGAAVWYFL